MSPLGPLLVVFLGGGLGSVLRWVISVKLNPLSHTLPLGTLAVNLLGSLIIGLALALFQRFAHWDSTWRLLITTGFCGGLTTFSTFSLEVILQAQQGRYLAALSNTLLNLVGTLLMVLLAFVLIERIYNPS